MTTEAQRLTDELLWVKHTADWIICEKAAALLRRQEAALMQARDALEPDVHRAEWVVEQDVLEALTAINELLGEQT